MTAENPQGQEQPAPEQKTQEQLLSKEESQARDLLAEAGYIYVVSENSIGQKVEIQVDMIRFMANVVRKFQGL